MNSIAGWNINTKGRQIMSEIEVDLIQFTGGPRRGEHAVMVEYAAEIAIFSLDGHAIMQWNGNDLGLDGSEWTLEIQCAKEWIDTNPWKFVEATSDKLKNDIQRIASDFEHIKPVLIGANQRPSAENPLDKIVASEPPAGRSETDMGKQFVAWARVSSARQKKEGFSLEDQELRLTEFAIRLGGSVVKLFKIAETASKRQERKTFQEFTTYVKRNAKRLAGMLFVKVDRAARNIRDWTDLEELADETGVPLVFPDQPTGATPAGRMQRRMSAVFASYQTDQQAVDIRGGHKRRIESGLPLGRQFGIRLVRVNGRSIVEHDPIDAPKVKRIFELFAYHPLTLETLIDALARQGIIYTDHSPRFTKSTLHRILHNRIYIGDVRYQGEWYPGKFEPLIDRATFQQVQDKFGTDFKVYHKLQLTFAGGLITCAYCGHVVTGEKKSKTSPNGTPREYSYYRCSRYAHAGHPRVRLNEEQIDQQLLEFCAGFRIGDAEACQWFVEVIKARPTRARMRIVSIKENFSVSASRSTPSSRRCWTCAWTARSLPTNTPTSAESCTSGRARSPCSCRPATTMAARSPTLPSKRLNFHKALASGGLRRTTKQNARFWASCSKPCV